MDDQAFYDKISSASTSLFDLALGHENNNDRYTDMEEIGNGVVKKIHRVLDLTSGRPVAMAVPQPELSKEQMQKFLEEARLTASLEHPNIMQVYDLGFNQEGKPYFTMKLCSSKKLSDILDNESRAPLFHLMDIYLRICEAVACAHSTGAVHRDLKPENILLGNFGEVLVADWGSAQILKNSNLENEVGQLSKPLTKGTPGFMAPEITDGVEPAVTQDIYALGALLYNILTGKPPENDHPEAPSSVTDKTVPTGLEAICLKAMSGNPRERYQTAEELISDVTAWMSGFAPEAEGASFSRQLRLMISRHKALSASIAASILIIAVISGVYISTLKDKEKQTRVQRDRAEKALKLYDLEKEIRSKIAKLGAKHFIDGARQMTHIHSLIDAEDLLNALPENSVNERQKKQIYALRGRIAFYRQQFNKCLEFYSKGEGEDKHFLVGVAKEFLKRKPDDSKILGTQDMVDILDRVNHFKTQHAYGLYRYQILHYTDVLEQEQIIKKMILVNNENLNDLNISLYEKDGKYHVDVSNNPGLVNMVPIRKVPLTTLNMSKSPVSTRQFYVLFDMPLEELNLSGCGIKDYRFLEDMKSLKRLILNEREARSGTLNKFRDRIEIVIAGG